MTLTEGQHDATTLSCVSSTLEDTEGMLDMPFSFYFGVPPHTELFQGYITMSPTSRSRKGRCRSRSDAARGDEDDVRRQAPLLVEQVSHDGRSGSRHRQPARVRWAPPSLPVDGPGADRGERLGDGHQAGPSASADRCSPATA